MIELEQMPEYEAALCPETREIVDKVLCNVSFTENDDVPALLVTLMQSQTIERSVASAVTTIKQMVKLVERVGADSPDVLTQSRLDVLANIHAAAHYVQIFGEEN